MYTMNQPHLMGGPIYIWNRYARCRIVVYMTQAQVARNAHQTAINLLDRHGRPVPLRVELQKNGGSRKTIGEILIQDPQKIVDRHTKTLRAVYGKAPWFSRLFPEFVDTFQEVLTYPAPTLGQYNVLVTNLVARLLQIPARFIMDTSPRPEDASTWLASTGLQLGDRDYLGGQTAKSAYVRQEVFDRYQVQYHVQDWKLRGYQRTVKTTNTDSSVWIGDPLFYLGPEQTTELIRD